MIIITESEEYGGQEKALLFLIKNILDIKKVIKIKIITNRSNKLFNHELEKLDIQIVSLIKSNKYCIWNLLNISYWFQLLNISRENKLQNVLISCGNMDFCIVPSILFKKSGNPLSLYTPYFPLFSK